MSARLPDPRVGILALLGVVALRLGAARGDPAPTPDGVNAPVPDAESGQTWNAETESQSSASRDVAHGLLFLPESLIRLVLLPVRGLVWVYDRYDLEDRYYATFFNTARTFGIHPQIDYGTGVGILLGAQLVSTDTFGEKENLTITGTYGGTYQARASAWLNSGKRLDPVLLTIGGNFERYAELPFYGIGNANGSPQPAALINPLTDDTAVKTYYRYQELRAALTADWSVYRGLHLIGDGEVTDMSFSGSTYAPSITTVYNPSDLVGFQQGVTHLYGQLELRVDQRHIAHPRWETLEYTTGWLVSGFAGRVHGFDQAYDFTHYGVDLQGFIHFGLGPRLLWLRFRGEGVTGNRDEVPYVELPYLGGDFLRGYDYARFRDRVAALGTAQYMWDVQRGVDLYLFVDAGRVYDTLDHLTFDGLRVGYGIGIDLHTATDFLLAVSLATSIDGGAFLTAVVAPYWDRGPRWR